MSTYAKLWDILAARTGSIWKVSFSELERLIGAKLPASAFKYPAWWSNNPSNNAMTKIWLNAGWRTEQVNIPGQTVVFRNVADIEAAGAATRLSDLSREFEYASARAPETKMAHPPGEAAEAAAIGRRIRAAREKMGMSEAMLAVDLGLDAGAVMRLEAGFGLEALVRMKRMATVLNMSADDLLGIGGGASQEAPKARPRFDDTYGCMTGTMKIMPGVDLIAPLSDEWEANEAKWEARFGDPEYGLSKLAPKSDKPGR
jgi:transcriptional regulator with XRE-family HTH domain